MKKSFVISLVLSLLMLSAFAQGLPAGLSPELAAKFSKSTGTQVDDSPSGLNNLPTPNMAMANKDYMVTAGDIYNLSFLAGNTPISYMITVDTNYKIRVANLAVLTVANTKFTSLKRQVEEIVTKNYPMSGVQFNLVTPGTFKIVVKGEVDHAQEVNGWALTRLSEVVYQYKNEYGSIRNVEITSKNGSSKSYDLFLADRDGDFSQNPYLRPDDIITIKPYDRKVTINGAVKRPGTYELLEGENLSDLINNYGYGFAHMANTSSIELVRTYKTKDSTGEKIFLNEEDITSNYALLPYDEILVKTFKDELPVVFVQGAITGDNTGKPTPDVTATVNVNFTLGETYEMLVKNMKSLFGSNADLTKAYVLRGEEVIPLNIYDILYNDVNNNVLIEPNDNLTIPSKTLSVSVIGAVKVPGRYPYLPNKNWSYYVDLAGGFIEERNSFEQVKIVDSNGKKLSKNDIITPETTITANTNEFMYYVNKYSPLVSSVAATIALVTTIISLSK